MAFDQIKYQNEYNKKKYVMKNLAIPVKEYEKIDEYRRKKGYKSFTNFILDVIRKEMNENPSKITIGDINQQGDNNNIQIKG